MRALLLLLTTATVAVLAFGLQAEKPAHAATTFTFTVDRSDDPDLAMTPTAGECTAADNDCSLRGAINAANSNGNPAETDTISFDIPDDPSTTADDVKTILVDGANGPTSTNLPEITEAVTIDGYSQPGASPNTNTTLAQGTNAKLLIELDGALLGSSGIGLRINTSNVVVKGLVINRFLGGIFISGTTSNNKVEGNFIGTDPSGTRNLSNFDYGVTVFGNSSANTIGGQEPAARNLISGNGFRGLEIFGNGGNTIQGNLIGTKANGTESGGNGLVGVEIFSPNNTVGGDGADNDDAAEANLIAFNGTDGVRVTGGRNNAFAVGNRILNNSIFENGDLGIELDGGKGFSNPDGDGVTANDRRDRDTGPNTLQNFPVLSSAKTSGGTTAIKGTLKSVPKKTFTIQFFSSPQKDSSGFGEGKTFIGETSVTTNRRGNGPFTFTPAQPVTAGEFVTATATNNLTGDTSEFSKAVTAS